MNCRKCGSDDVRRLGTTCEEARQEGKFHTEYHADGAVYGGVGVHHRGYNCRECGYSDVEVCIHD